METRTVFIVLIAALVVLVSGIIGYRIYKDWSTPKEILKHYFTSNETLKPNSDKVLEFYSRAGGNITGTINATKEINVYILDTLNYFEYKDKRNISAAAPVFATNGTKINLEWYVSSDNYWYVVLYNKNTEDVVIEYDVWCRFLS
ncbi:MAG: hypothetical protein QW531_00080 [Thermoplasmata archaeon]